MGDDVLDSPLLRDSINAAIFVAAHRSVDSAALVRDFGNAGDIGARITTLRAAGLLRKSDERYRASVPIVIGAEKAWYDSITRVWAESTLTRIEPGIDSLARLLAARGWEDWTYHFAWSQIFDSQRLWTVVQRADVTPPLAPAITWIVYPANPTKTGTNYFPGRADTKWFLAVTWTPAHREQLALENLAESLLSRLSGHSTAAADSTRLRAAGLLNAKDSIAIPILREADPLLAMVRDLSERWARAAIERIDARLLGERLQIDPRVAWAMAYHDVSWDALGSLQATGIVHPLPSVGTTSLAHGSAVLVPTEPGFIALLVGDQTTRR